VLYFVIYLAVMSLAGVILTLHDKQVSRIPGHRRIPEAALLAVAALGGSVFMLLAMRLSCHKTQHAKFMLGIPCIILLQVAVLYVLIFKLNIFKIL